MNLILTEIRTLIATEDITCEASEIYWQLPRPISFVGVTYLDFALFFKSRFGKAKVGERYLNLVFADDDGEIFEMKVLPKMNRFMYRMKFYPDFIQNALEDFKERYRLNQTI